MAAAARRHSSSSWGVRAHSCGHCRQPPGGPGRRGDRALPRARRLSRTWLHAPHVVWAQAAAAPADAPSLLPHAPLEQELADEALKEVLRTCTQLTELIIYGIDTFSGAAFARAGEGCRLRRLALLNCIGLTDEGCGMR